MKSCDKTEVKDCGEGKNVAYFHIHEITVILQVLPDQKMRKRTDLTYDMEGKRGF